jgi:hypothetical protein
MEQVGSHWKDFHEILYGSVFRKCVVKIKVSLSLTRIAGNLRKDRYTFFIISLSVRLRTGTVSNKSCTENQNTHFMFNIFSQNRVVYKIMWKNTVELDRPQIKIWRMRIACWIPKATNTHSEYVSFIAFPLQ